MPSITVGVADLLVYWSSHWRHEGGLLKLGIRIRPVLSSRSGSSVVRHGS